jgi:hypothetical protein
VTPQEPEQHELGVAVAGTVAWLVALVVLAVGFRHQLHRHHTEWWLWSCGFGALLGLYGVRTALRRRR